MAGEHILIVEDDPIIAKDISSLLKPEGYLIVGVAHDGITALDLLSNRSPDLVMLDVHLGTGMSGIDVAEVIHRKYVMPFIFLTSFSDDDTLEAAQTHGPYGYLVKPFQDRSLITTVKTALSNFQRQQLQNENQLQNLSDDLTAQELKIIEEVMSGKSNQQIAEHLFVSINTVKYHLKNVFFKCDVSSRSELITKALL